MVMPLEVTLGSFPRFFGLGLGFGAHTFLCILELNLSGFLKMEYVS